MEEHRKRLLIVEDNRSLRDMYVDYLQAEGHEALSALSGQEALDYLREGRRIDLLILDIKLPDMNGLELLEKMRALGFNAPVIVITGYGSIKTAIQSMHMGASDFLIKPFDIEKLGRSVKKVLKGYGLITKAAVTENLENLAGHVPESKDPAPDQVPGRKAHFGKFIGTSRAMQLVYDVIENAARSNATIFITGESGTGKELCAEAVHKCSARAGKTFIAINCAAIPRELMESELFGHVKGAFTNAITDRQGAVQAAHGGTLFLDEICEMDPDMQSKLLRFLQDLKFQKVGSNREETADVRIICATNKDPLEEIRDGRFREDLYYRLHVIPIHLPPLRKRGEDVIDLAEFFLSCFARDENKPFTGLTGETEALIRRFPWPGNIRQLQNIMRNIVVLQNGPVITPDMLPYEIRDYEPDSGQESRPDIKIPQPDIRLQTEEDGARSGSVIEPLWKTDGPQLNGPLRCAMAMCRKRRLCLKSRHPLFTAKNRGGTRRNKNRQPGSKMACFSCP